MPLTISSLDYWSVHHNFATVNVAVGWSVTFWLLKKLNPFKTLSFCKNLPNRLYLFVSQFNAIDPNGKFNYATLKVLTLYTSSRDFLILFASSLLIMILQTRCPNTFVVWLFNSEKLTFLISLRLVLIRLLGNTRKFE